VTPLSQIGPSSRFLAPTGAARKTEGSGLPRPRSNRGTSRETEGVGVLDPEQPQNLSEKPVSVSVVCPRGWPE